ncbi:MAG: hypothetical protein E7670_08435 [Ruminococcaceae bacterium]|nr:hypothetical protein [Oscillospiraceae bacterium]
MKIETKEKIKKLFGWKLFGILYVVSFAFSCVWTCVRTLYEGTFDLLIVIINSFPFFAYALIICGVIGMITMIVLKAGKMKILFSILMMVAGIVVFACCVPLTVWWLAFLIILS